MEVTTITYINLSTKLDAFIKCNKFHFSQYFITTSYFCELHRFVISDSEVKREQLFYSSIFSKA